MVPRQRMCNRSSSCSTCQVPKANRRLKQDPVSHNLAPGHSPTQIVTATGWTPTVGITAAWTSAHSINPIKHRPGSFGQFARHSHLDIIFIASLSIQKSPMRSYLPPSTTSDIPSLQPGLPVQSPPLIVCPWYSPSHARYLAVCALLEAEGP